MKTILANDMLWRMLPKPEGEPYPGGTWLARGVGIPVITDSAVPEYVEEFDPGPLPRSKRKRIRKKWRKRHGKMVKERVMFLLSPGRFPCMMKGFTL